MSTQVQYQHLEPRPGSNYRQLWVKGRHIRAEVLYRLTVGAERRTPEEVAQDYNLPVEVVHEAIAYARHSQDLLEAERAREEVRIQQLGLHKPPFIPPDTSTDI
jgi:uncharacterized protein (DUF433 family)